MTYRNQAFSYVATQAQQIKDTASVLGISAMAIAGAMAEEHDSMLSRLSSQLALDAYAAEQLKIGSEKLPEDRATI